MPTNFPDYHVNRERFTAFANDYDRYRPAPPPLLRTLLCRYAGIDRPKRVVDIGCGTGLSTRYWIDHADDIFGVEPTKDMRDTAERNTTATNIHYVEGYGHATGLEAGSADIVTASQAFHWMEPTSTLAEVARVLRSGGVFAAYDCDWPPMLFVPEAEIAYREFVRRCHEIEAENNLADGLRRFDKTEHLNNIKNSNHFSFVREILLHHEEQGDADRLLHLAMTQGGVQTIHKAGYSLEEMGYLEFEEKVRTALKDNQLPWMWSYRVRLGVR